MTPDASAPSDELAPEAAFWKARYEEERLRLAKLLVAYKDLEAELRRMAKPAPAPQAAATSGAPAMEAKSLTPA